MSGSPECPWLPGKKDTRPGGDHRFIGGSTHAHSQHHTTTARLLDTRNVTSAHSWGPEAVGSSVRPCGPDPAGCLPPGQLGEGRGVGPGPGTGKRAGKSMGGRAQAPPPLLQGLEHQQLFQHLRLAGLADLARQEHLIHDRVNLGEGRWREAWCEGRGPGCWSKPGAGSSEDPDQEMGTNRGTEAAQGLGPPSLPRPRLPQPCLRREPTL